jgi:lipopolysaccharide transport system permease protein
VEQRIEGARRRWLVPRARQLKREDEPVAGASSEIVTVIEPSVRADVELRELWRARDLALRLAWRDVKVRYKQSLIGITWAVLQPFLTMVVFTIIFGKYAHLPAQGLPYQVFSMLNLVPWAFLASVFTATAASVLSNRVLVQKVYFPRLILPLSCVLVPLVDFAFAFAVAIGVTLFYSVGIHTTVLLAPLFLLMLAATAIGLGSVLAVINVPYAVPFLVQIWLFLSGVIYASASLPHKYLLISSLNPAVAGITGFRWAVVGTPPPTAGSLALGSTVAAVVLIGGLAFYRRSESRFADTI